MASYDFNLRLVSPAFIAGTDKNRPEMRATSIRGQMRYWYRAARGATLSDTVKLHEQESKVFGSTTEGSKFSLLVVPRQTEAFHRVAMLPHKSNPRERSETAALNSGQLYDLRLVSRPNDDIKASALASLAIWSLLGGLGRRSRRMFGGVRVTAHKDSPAKELWYDAISQPEQLAQTIQTVLSQSVKSDAALNNALPAFPTLHERHAWVMVGKRGYEDVQELVVDLFRELLRKDEFRAKEQSFGYVRPTRRAGTLHAQVRQIGELYYPVLTVLRSKPDRDIDWKHLNKFMEAAHEFFDGTTAWGGAFK